jgi:hypothetical protein
MALWRAEALKRLPELRKAIDSSDTIMALWIELYIAFERAYERNPRDESLISRIYSFADWCEKAPRGTDAGRDPSTAVVIGFYEDIPNHSAARDDMPRWFTYAEVAQDKRLFSYKIGEEKYRELLQYMSRNQHRYVGRTLKSGGYNQSRI